MKKASGEEKTLGSEFGEYIDGMLWVEEEKLPAYKKPFGEGPIPLANVKPCISTERLLELFWEFKRAYKASAHWGELLRHLFFYQICFCLYYIILAQSLTRIPNPAIDKFCSQTFIMAMG